MVVGGDFNTPHQAWGCSRDTAKGRDLMHEATEQGYILITDHKQPTRTAPTSTQRDSTPDPIFVKNVGEVTWRNTREDLGSDHYILEIELKNEGGRTIEHKWTDWDAFRLQIRNGPGQTDIEDIEAWTTELRKGIQEATKNIATNKSVPCVDSRLAHLIDARKSIKEPWKKQRWNRKLRKKVTELNRSIEKHSALLCRQQWDEVCNRIDGSLHQNKAWSLIRHLLDETKTKSYQQNRMAQVMHEAKKSLGKEELIQKLKTKYMPQAETEKHPGYAGAPNEKLDREITTPEVTQAIRQLNSRSAAGPDGVSNKALRNLDDSSIEALTKYYNKCWQSVSRLNMGERSNKYIEDFLTGRKIELRVGEIEIPEQDANGVGTPQGSVISPLFFNIVMIRVAKAVAEVKGVRHTVYADDITLWTAGGTDAGIERRIQKAITAIENSLERTGLQCSPAKSELLTYTPRKPGKQPLPPRECDRLEIITKTGQWIPEVQEIRVLGMFINGKATRKTS
ncbi:uncharacterized protein LOC144168602 [Haemaphysalis longicornis]